MKFKNLIKYFICINLILFNNRTVSPETNSYANSSDVLKEDTWVSDITQTPISLQGHTSAVVEGKLYVIGGINSGNCLNSVYVYNPRINKWESKAPMPTKRAYLTSVSVGKKIYCFGGWDSGVNLDSVEVYDVEKDEWEVRRAMPSKRREFTSSISGNKVYLIGGHDYDLGARVGSLDVYDIDSDTWEKKADMPTVRNDLTSRIVGNKIYVIGGYDGIERLDKLEVYDIDKNTWEEKSPMPTPRSYLSSSSINNKIYVIGGTTNDQVNEIGDNVTNVVEMYDPETDKWIAKASMPNKRTSFSSAILNGRIYCVGGRYKSDLNSVDVYTPETKEYITEQEVENAVLTGTVEDISYARELVNSLSESSLKDQLQIKLNQIFATETTLEKLVATSNLDVYIKTDNILAMSLDTNSVSFDNYSGIADVEIKDALTITVDSSLPYNMNVSMPAEISNADGSLKIDFGLFNIKESNEANYQYFRNVTDKLVLKSNCEKGEGKVHKIDLKLTSNQAHKADIYKTVLKFEIEQR